MIHSKVKMPLTEKKKKTLPILQKIDLATFNLPKGYEIP